MLKRFSILLLVFIFLALTAYTAFGHGAVINYETETAYKLVASYDGGQQMSEAQVIIFAPNDPTTPWQNGTTNEQGEFMFTPDNKQAGIWNIQVRSAGHGAMISIDTSAGGQAKGSTGYTPLQLVIMAGSVIWGLIGTALYFKRR